MKSAAGEFVSLLRESVILQGFITAVLISSCAYLWVTGQPIPQDLQLVTGVVVGFFFGGKVQNIVSKGVR